MVIWKKRRVSFEICKEKMKQNKFDALIIVHPALDTPNNPKPFNSNYRKNLTTIVKQNLFLNKPVFIPKDGVKLYSEYHQELFVSAIWIPEYKEEELYPLRQHQKQVNFIADKIGKTPEKIKVAFGGLWADACVYGYCRSFCKKVITDYPGNFSYESCQNPLSLGVVLNEII